MLCAVICFSAAEYCVQRFVILPGFLSLERDEAVRDADRVSKAISNEINHLNSLGWDWSAWDDTYDFVASGSGKYIASNLVMSTFTGNHLNLIYICDNDGRVIWGKAYDLSEEKEIKLDLFPENILPPKHPLLIGKKNPNLTEADIKGVLNTDAGPLAVSATPILKSNDDGPLRGTLIMGRFLNSDMVRQIAEQAQVDFSLMPIDASAVRQVSKNIANAPYKIEIIDNDQLKVHSIVSDINGNPALALTTNFYRNISSKGYETVHNGILSILIPGMGILILVLLSLKKTILQPISRLNRHVLSIKKTGDLSKRLKLNRHDEIGMLAYAFDRMVSRIEKMTTDNNEVNKQLRKDIEKRKQAEAALMESEKRFRTLIEQAGDLVFLHDDKGNIRLVNRSAYECLGYEESQLLNLSIRDVDPEAFIPDGNYSFKNINYNQTVVFESQYQRRDDSFLPVDVSLTPIHYGGEKLILSIARDIAKRKQENEQIQQTQKMEAMKTLTAGIAHNFNNILTVIIGCTELAAKSLSREDPVLNLLKKIEDAGIRAKDIVWQLIRFSEKQESNFLPVAMYSVIEKEIQRLESVTAGKIKLISQLQSDCCPIFGNVDQFRDLMKNLLENAVESINNGRGVVEVELENMGDANAAGLGNASANLKGKKCIRLSIRDNGRGIDPSHMDRIFDPYFTTKDFSKGAGMGLAVVHGIVINHGGAITVDSKVGRGTEIRVFFPAAQQHRSAK